MSFCCMAEALTEAGHRVCNIDYPSRHHPLRVLAHEEVLPRISACFDPAREPLSFVTHSLGGILVRQLRRDGALPHLSRAVMLGPPNGGSEVVDKLGDWAVFGWLNGPAGRQLGTAPDAPPRQLGPADFELGIIAGERSINPLLSLLIPGEDDGKVAIDHARLEGMQDFLVLPVSHPFLMRDEDVIAQTLHFLATGQFRGHDSPPGD